MKNTESYKKYFNLNFLYEMLDTDTAGMDSYTVIIGDCLLD